MSWSDLIDEVGAVSPRTQAVLDEWREPDEYVSFVNFMSDIARLAAVMFIEESVTASARRELDALMEIVERRLTIGDHDEYEAILTGFLELLPSSDEPGYAIRERLGARAAFDLYFADGSG